MNTGCKAIGGSAGKVRAVCWQSEGKQETCVFEPLSLSLCSHLHRPTDQDAEASSLESLARRVSLRASPHPSPECPARSYEHAR